MFSTLITGLLATTLVTARDVAAGGLVTQRVAIRGVIAAAVHDDLDDGFNWILLKTPEGTICASTNNRVHPLDELLPLLDAEVELTGSVQRFSHWRRFLGYQMLFDNPEEGDRLVVLRPPADDPFASPPLTDTSYPHRQTATGSVVARTDDSFFLQRTNDVLRIRLINPDDMPSVGVRVVASGFAEESSPFPQLIGAIWRGDSNETVPPESPTNLLARQLFKTDYLSQTGGSQHRYADMAFCGRIIRLSGRVDSIVRPATGHAALRLDCDGETVFVDLSGFDPDELAIPETDTVISVAGLYFADFDTGRNPIFPRLLGFVVIPRTADDIQILRRAPFWTIPRLACALALVLLLAVALAVWSISVRRIATRRGRELAREQILGARAELKVEERTRLAVELHDSLSQTLTGVALQIDAAAGADGENARTFLSTARNMLASCRQELNGCLWDLRSRTFEEKDMTEAVQRTLAPHVRAARLAVRFNVPRERLSEATAHAVLRIARELATNAVKHGHAKNIKIAGEFHDDIISFSVLDDGDGFDPASAPGPIQGHFGLQGVRERLNDFNGTIQCESKPGEGAKFTVVLHTPPTETK